MYLLLGWDIWFTNPSRVCSPMQYPVYNAYIAVFFFYFFYIMLL